MSCCANLQVIIYKRDVTVFKMIILYYTSFFLTSYLYELYYMMYMYILNEEDIYYIYEYRKGEPEWRTAKHIFLYTLLLYLSKESCVWYENTHIFLFLKKVFFTILRFVSHEYKTHIYITIPRSL